MNNSSKFKPYPGVEVLGVMLHEFHQVLTPEAMAFVASLHRNFNSARLGLLRQRAVIRNRINNGETPDFCDDTKSIRDGDWKVSPVPSDLQDRRVEITGPTDRKMVINALNSGASVFMADLEDSATPTWSNMVNGQINLMDAARKTITFDDSNNGKHYKLKKKTAVLMARPRGWHLDEENVLVDGEPISGSLFDFGLYFFHNAKSLISGGGGPYFYLPKLENAFEARLWNEIFEFSEDALNLPIGTIRATVLIETILAAFEMDEILYELRDHSAGLNCGRWDYIFSFIKKFQMNKNFILPDRASVTMTSHFLRSYSLLLIQTCHKRGAHAIGGMAAQIPIRNDEEANNAAMEKVTADKLREATDGHDGTWVAHPGLVKLAKDIFDKAMPKANQLHVMLEDVSISAEDLLTVPQGEITEAGLRQNINVGIRYIESWLRGNGCVPLYNLMEDAATAEISRTQIWQWIKYSAQITETGQTIDEDLVFKILNEELINIKNTVGNQAFWGGFYGEAEDLFRTLLLSDVLEEFLTVPAYKKIMEMDNYERVCFI